MRPIARPIAVHIHRVGARRFVCVAEVEAAIAEYEGEGQSRRGRSSLPWRSYAPRYRVNAVSGPQKRYVEVVRRKRRRPRLRSAIAWRYRQRLCLSPRMPIGGHGAKSTAAYYTSLSVGRQSLVAFHGLRYVSPYQFPIATRWVDRYQDVTQ